MFVKKKVQSKSLYEEVREGKCKKKTIKVRFWCETLTKDHKVSNRMHSLLYNVC